MFRPGNIYLNIKRILNEYKVKTYFALNIRCMSAEYH